MHFERRWRNRLPLSHTNTQVDDGRTCMMHENDLIVSNFNLISFDDAITFVHFIFVFLSLLHFIVCRRWIASLLNIVCDSFDRELLNVLLMALVVIVVARGQWSPVWRIHYLNESVNKWKQKRWRWKKMRLSTPHSRSYSRPSECGTSYRTIRKHKMLFSFV